MDSNKQTQNEYSFLQKSSMMTYSKVACCICGCQVEASLTAMCETCFKNQIDISEGISKEGVVQYCKLCDRFLKGSQWLSIARESSEMMSLCLPKIKGLNKNIKIMDSCFIWTEPHSKRIKIKLTIQKEVLNRLQVQKSFVVDFTEDWIQCDECKKSFTPHHWVASCQVRQKVSHKQTFLLLEQIVIKHHMQTKTVGVKEYPEGIDFYFASVPHATMLKDFIMQYFPSKVKTSKQLISHDQYSNTFNYKYCYSIEIAPVCKDEIVVIPKQISKELGGAAPILLCYKISSNVHLIDTNNFNTYQFDEHSYWKYNFKSFIDRRCLQEFRIISVTEDLEYKKHHKNHLNSTLHSNKNYDSKSASLANSRISLNHDKNEFMIVDVCCVRNGDTDEQTINIKSHLGEKMRPGDIFLGKKLLISGYDMTSLNFNWEIEIILEKSKYPEVILVKKKVKRKNKKRNWKIKRLVMEEGETVPIKETKSKQIKKQELEDQQYEQFLEDIELDKELRSKVNLYRDEEMRKIIEKNGNNEEVKNEADEEEDEEIIGIVENELLDDLNFKEEEIISTSNLEKIKEEEFVEEEKEIGRIEKKEKEKPKEKGIYIDTGLGKKKKKKKEK